MTLADDELRARIARFCENYDALADLVNNMNDAWRECRAEVEAEEERRLLAVYKRVAVEVHRRKVVEAEAERRRFEAVYAKVRAKVALRFNEDGSPREQEKVAETG